MILDLQGNALSGATPKAAELFDQDPPGNIRASKSGSREVDRLRTIAQSDQPTSLRN